VGENSGTGESKPGRKQGGGSSFLLEHSLYVLVEGDVFELEIKFTHRGTGFLAAKTWVNTDTVELTEQTPLRGGIEETSRDKASRSFADPRNSASAVFGVLTTKPRDHRRPLL
jgi:hypothetical protein